ncbi:hypothetical protein ACWGXJ_25460 [Paenibacillus sp. S33]
MKLVESKKERFTHIELGLDFDEFLEYMKDVKSKELVNHISFLPNEDRATTVFTNNLSLTNNGKDFIKLKEGGKT